MKKAFTIFLSVLILFQAFNRLGILLSFQWNQEYISKVLCINKEKVELQCHGKCYLKAQLEQETQKEKKQGFSEQQIDIPLFFQKIDLIFVPFHVFSQKLKNFIFYRFPYYFTFLSKIAHPPSC